MLIRKRRETHMPIMMKILGIIIAGAIAFSPMSQPEPVAYETARIENAQTIANKLHKPVKVWMDGIGHVNILPADQSPQTPFTILHSTWKPRAMSAN
jgi:hypothetical protein